MIENSNKDEDAKTVTVTATPAKREMPVGLEEALLQAMTSVKRDQLLQQGSNSASINTTTAV